MAAPRILVVDDQVINVQLLKRKLEREGHIVLSAYSGQEAIDIVNREKPDLILLDVMMPEMDGLEVCQRLQAREDTRSIPIIFITARNSKEGKLEGLAIGAVDYITKPIDLDETSARVQTQLRFVAINRERADLQRRLTEARHAATIGAVTQGIALNLNNLLGVAIGYVDLIQSTADKPDSVRRNAKQLESAIERIVSIVKQLNSLVGKSQQKTTPRRLDELLQSSVARFQQAVHHPAGVEIENPLGDLILHSHVEVFENIVGALLMNGWEAYGDGEEGERPLRVVTEDLPGSSPPRIAIRVEDFGNGVDPKIRDHMFEPFVSSKHTVGVGMGLTIARHALRSLGGDLELQDLPTGGTVAIVHHPINPSARRAFA